MNETTIKLDTQIWPLHIHLGLEAPAASEEEGWDWEGRLLPPHSQKSPGLCGESLAHNRGSLHGQHRDGGRRLGRDGCREGADLTCTFVAQFADMIRPLAVYFHVVRDVGGA